MSAHRARFEFARNNYSKALTRLHEALAMDESSYVRDAVIQRFEFCYELAWKSMFYWIRDQGEQVPEMVRPVFEMAFRALLIDDFELWSKLKDCRDETSHTYNEATAVTVAAFVRGPGIRALDAYGDRIETL